MNKEMTDKLKDNIKKLVEQGQLNQAKSLLEEYKNIVKDDIDIYSIMGIIYMMEGNMDDAEAIFKKGLELDSNDFDLVYNIAYFYEVTEDTNKAMKYYELAKDITITKEQEQEIAEKLKSLKMIDHLEEKYKKDKENTRVEDKAKVERIDERDNIEKENIHSIYRFFNAPIDKKILKEFKNKNFNAVVQNIQLKINQRQYEDVIAICNYWLNKVDKSTAIIYYFIAVAANGIKDFNNALKYHSKALELDNTLADLRHRKSKYQYKYKEKIINCIGCGSEAYEVVNISNQSISEDNKELINPIRRWVKCKKCSLIYSNPIPEEKSLNEYYSVIAKEKFGGIYGNIDDRFEFLVSMANKRLEKIEKYVGGAKTILDIGTGIGVFTGTALDRGWEAEGLEFTPEDCNYAKEKFGLELKQDNFYDFQENRTYDVVTLFEVIEHLHHPLKDLKQINKLIKDDGLLLIATPIQDSLYGKKMKENNVFWNVVTHLSYFTKEVMLNYLEDAGFQVIEISGSNEGMGRMEFYCRKI